MDKCEQYLQPILELTTSLVPNHALQISFVFRCDSMNQQSQNAFVAITKHQRKKKQPHAQSICVTVRFCGSKWQRSQMWINKKTG